MDFLVVNTYDNYVEAHIVRGRLEEEGINCWLKDENSVTLDPMLSNAIGGIKLMVIESQVERAVVLLREHKAEKQNLNPCPRCDSRNIEMITTMRKAGNWISFLISLLFVSKPLPINQVYHCFSCNHEYPLKDEQLIDNSTA